MSEQVREWKESGHKDVEEERFVSGFCKAQNQTRMVICVIETNPDGLEILQETDCAWGDCPHTADCLLIGNMINELQK